MTTLDKRAGFTAVELLLTLFIAAAFLVAGYQLFNLIIKDGGQDRADARASNLAYDYLRRYSTSASATNPCVAATPLSNSAITVSGLSSTTVTVAITCPYSAASPPIVTISKVEVTVLYNSPQQTMKYSTYVNI